MNKVFLYIAVLLLSACSFLEPAIPRIVFEEESYDFGVLKQSGGIVSHDFLFTYQGDMPLSITGTPASCACTTGSVNKSELLPGETGILTVRFNPNLHAEPKGRFYKSVSILSKPSITPLPEVKIWQEIDLDLGEEAYELKDAEHEDEENEGSDHDDHHS